MHSCKKKKKKKSQKHLHHLCANCINVVRKLGQGGVHGFAISLAFEPRFQISRRVGITWKHTDKMNN